MLSSQISKFQSVSLYSQLFWSYRRFLKNKCSEWPKWPWTLQGQMYPIYVLLVSMSPLHQSSQVPNLSLFHSAASRFGITDHFETSAPNDPKTTLNTTSRFQDSRLSKIGNQKNWKCTEWPQNNLKHLTVKSTLYTLSAYPEAQILVRFALQPAVFQIQGSPNRRCGKWTPGTFSIWHLLCTVWPQNDLKN